jgi:hypothetical protein
MVFVIYFGVGEGFVSNSHFYPWAQVGQKPEAALQSGQSQ